MRKIAGMLLLVLGVAGAASAVVVSAPEVDPGSAISALAILGGVVLLKRSR